MAPVIIIGGIVSGVFTPTEASVVACVYALILGWSSTRKSSCPICRASAGKRPCFTIRIMFIISVAGFFGWLLIHQTIPQQVIDRADRA